MHCALICLYCIFFRVQTLVNIRIWKELLLIWIWKEKLLILKPTRETKSLNNFPVTLPMSLRKKRTKITLITYLIELVGWTHSVWTCWWICFHDRQKRIILRSSLKKNMGQHFFSTNESGYFLRNSFLLTFLPLMHQASMHIYLCLCFKSCVI